MTEERGERKGKEMFAFSLAFVVSCRPHSCLVSCLFSLSSPNKLVAVAGFEDYFADGCAGVLGGECVLNFGFRIADFGK